MVKVYRRHTVDVHRKSFSEMLCDDFNFVKTSIPAAAIFRSAFYYVLSSLRHFDILNLEMGFLTEMLRLGPKVSVLMRSLSPLVLKIEAYSPYSSLLNFPDCTLLHIAFGTATFGNTGTKGAMIRSLINNTSLNFKEST